MEVTSRKPHPTQPQANLAVPIPCDNVVIKGEEETSTWNPASTARNGDSRRSATGARDVRRREGSIECVNIVIESICSKYQFVSTSLDSKFYQHPYKFS